MAKKKSYSIVRNNDSVVRNITGQASAREILNRIGSNLVVNNHGRYAYTSRKADTFSVAHIPTKTTDVYAIVPN